MSPELLKTTLTDLAEEVGAGPRDVDGLVVRSWSAGTRRRRRSAVGRGMALAAVLVALALLASPLGRFGALAPAGSEDRADPVSAYPQRIGHQWFVQAEDGRGGPAAGLLQAGLAWYVVRPSGNLSSLPRNEIDSYPTLSDDGRWLVYQDGVGRAAPSVVLDLVTGARIPTSRPVELSPQMPAFWSPDGRTVLVSDQRAAGLWSLVSVDGTVSTPRLGEGLPAGWLSDVEALVVTQVDAPADPRYPPGTTLQYPRLWAVDVRTGTRRALPAPQSSRPFEFLGQYGVALAPDRTRVVVGLSAANLYGGQVALFDISSGAPVAWPGTTPVTPDEYFIMVPSPATPCGVSWRGQDPLVTTVRTVGGGAYVSALTSAYGDQTVVAIDPSFEQPCLQLATSALSGGPSWTPFGRQTAWVTWWWRELLAGGLVLAALWWLARRRQRRAGWLPAEPRDPWLQRWRSWPQRWRSWPRRWRAWLRRWPAWWRGVTRRQRAVLAVAGVAALGLFGPMAVPRLADVMGPELGYPQRIELNWTVADSLPPGAVVVGLLRAKDDTVAVGALDASEQAVRLRGLWYYVLADGALVRALPGWSSEHPPVLSPSGGSIGYPLGDQYQAGWLGATRTFPPQSGYPDPTPLPLAADQPAGAFWSPDGSRLALAGVKDGKDVVLVLHVQGGMREVPVPGPLAGWLSNDELLVLAGGTSAAADGAGSPITPTGVDLRSDPATVTARPALTYGRPADQLRGFSVSPDGAWAEGPGEDGTRMLLNLATPSDGASVNPIPVALDCPTQWGPNGPVYTVTPTDGGSAYLASWTDQYSPMVTIDPALDATCLVLTEQALAAGPRWNLLGTTGGWLVFQWRWVMAALLAGTLVTWVVLRGRSGSVAAAPEPGAGGEAHAEEPAGPTT